MTIKEFKKQNEKLSKQSSDLDYKLNTTFLPNILKRKRRKEAKDAKIERNNLKIKVKEYENRKVTAPVPKGSPAYYKELIEKEDYEINKINSKKPSHVPPVNKLREFNIKKHKANITKYTKKFNTINKKLGLRETESKEDLAKKLEREEDERIEEQGKRKKSSLAYYEYLIGSEQEKIKNLKDKKPSIFDTINKIRKEEIKDHQKNIATITEKLKAFRKKVQDLNINQNGDSEVLEKIEKDRKVLKPKGNKENTKKSHKDILKKGINLNLKKGSKNTKKNYKDILKKAITFGVKKINDKKGSKNTNNLDASKTDKKESNNLKETKELNNIDKSPNLSLTKEDDEKYTLAKKVKEFDKDEKPKNTKKELKKTSILNLSSSEIKNITSLDLDNLQKLIGVQKKILQKLTTIEKNMIDEQNTSITKASSLKSGDENIKVSKQGKGAGSNNSGSSWIMSLIEGYMGGSIFKRLFGKMFGRLLSPITTRWKKFTEYISEKFSILRKEVFGRIATFAKNFAESFKKNIKSILNPIWDTIKKSKLGQAVSHLKDAAEKRVSNIYNGVKNDAKDLYEAGKIKVSNVIDKVKNSKVIKKVSLLKEKASTAISKGKEWVSDLWSSGKKKASSVLESAKETAKEGWKNARKYASKAGTFIVKTGEKYGGKIFKMAKNSAEGVIQFGKQKIVKYGGKFLELAKEKVQPIIERIGIKAVGKSAFKQFTDKIPGIGILAGLGFGAYDLMQGKPEKAALDILAGVIPTVLDAAGLLTGPFAPLVMAAGLATSTGISMYADSLDKPKISKNPKKVQIKKLDNTEKKSKNNKTLGIPQGEKIPLKIKGIKNTKKKETKKTSTASIYEKLKKGYTIGNGSMSDVYLNIGPNKDMTITYKYNKDQKYVWTKDDLIKMVQDIRDNKEVSSGTSYIPKDKNHLNPFNPQNMPKPKEKRGVKTTDIEKAEKQEHPEISNIKDEKPKKVKVQVNKDKRILEKEDNLNNIVKLTPSSPKQVIINQVPPQNNNYYGNSGNSDTAVKLGETFEGISKY